MADDRSSMGSTLLKGLGLFIVIVAGIYAGFWISVKSGLTESLSGGPGNARAVNQTNVKTGDVFPSVAAAGIGGTEIPLGPVLESQKTILAFLSGTCEPCLMFAEAVPEWEVVESGEYQVVILTDSPDVFAGEPSFKVYQSSFPMLDSLNVRAFPTIFVIDESGEVQFVSSGYSKQAGESGILGRVKEDDAA